MTIEKNKIKLSLKDLQKTRGAITFGRLLIAYRASTDLTQIELADKLGLSKGNICDFEKERKVPSPAKASEMAKRLGELPQYWVEVAVQDMLHAQNLDYTVKIEGKKGRVA